MDKSEKDLEQIASIAFSNALKYQSAEVAVVATIFEVAKMKALNFEKMQRILDRKGGKQ